MFGDLMGAVGAGASGSGCCSSRRPVLSRRTGHRFRWVSARLPLLWTIVVARLGGVMTVSGVSGLTT